MYATGFLPWWKAALKTILALDPKDITPDLLKRKIVLPQANQPITLNELFTRLLNYIVFNQADVNCSSLPWLVSEQVNFLSPDNIFFEILQNNEISRLKHREVLAGHFSKEFFRIILDNSKGLSDNIGLIHSFDHTIQFGLKKDGK
ncbi:Uncharacterised protein [Legionella busanensis]|uniref:Uncharacterized protein n=1 Tax=Legionella busanensis TaxID=190655 RepID=A0A378JRU1_9GAMM|nr:hypothetical protein [Legionella busanensis]STX50852.1 Uncharacterised protein [Legionella busanensis]